MGPKQVCAVSLNVSVVFVVVVVVVVGSVWRWLIQRAFCDRCVRRFYLVVVVVVPVCAFVRLCVDLVWFVWIEG